MPSIIRAHCADCDSEGRPTPDWKGFSAYVTEKKPASGRLLASEYLAVLTEGGEIICLPHPLEWARLRSLGYSWFKASVTGRLLEVTPVVCDDCGDLSEQKRIVFRLGYSGCLVEFLPAVGVFILLKKFGGYTAFTALLVACGACFGPWLLLRVVLRLHFKKRQSELAVHECKHCHSHKLLTISQATRLVVVCPRCHLRSMHYEYVGKS